jgi:hypothetical protein
MLLSALNSNFESGSLDPPKEIWTEWLWGCDLVEPVSVDSLLNRAHLLGLLIARFRALREPELMDICVSLPTIVHMGSRVSRMTPRQLKDVLEDLQLRWETFIDRPEELTELVDACMTLFGHFNLHPSKYDDVGMRDASHEDRMNVLCIRRITSILCLMYRHLDLLHRWEEPPVGGGGTSVEAIQEFHVQSSMDEFHKHVMHSDLPPAALLNYRQDFAGFYHCVSQAVYFHFPSYERKAQLDLGSLRSGDHPLFALAPLVEMYPDIHLCYEDARPKAGVWNWMLMGKRVYLLDPTLGRVYYAPNLLRLMDGFLADV